MKKICKKCNIEKDINDFVKNKNCRDRHEGTCKECKNLIRQERYKNYCIEKGNNLAFKICSKCNAKKSIDEFAKDLKARDGRRNSCKQCDNKRIALRKKYNKNNLNEAFWNLKAKSINKRADSKNITAQQLIQLYNKQNSECKYCHIELNGVFHIDHKKSLSCGGEHNINNICFTCPDCNRLKHTRSDEEFITFIAEYIKRFI